MEQANSPKGIRDAAALLGSFLRPVARLQVAAGFGSDTLIGAAKRAMLEAATDHLAATRGRVSVSSLAVLTGLTRKEIAALKRDAPGPARAGVARQDRREQRMARVERGWRTDPDFLDRRGRPAALPLRDGPSAFSELVRRYGGDVTPASLLRELERTSMVRRDRSGRVRLLARRRGASGTEQQFAELARLFTDFAGSVATPVKPGAPPLFVGFRDESTLTSDEAARFRRTFAQRGTHLLESVDQWVGSRPQGRLKPEPPRRVGLGIYMIDEPAESTRGRKPLRPNRA